MHIYYFISGIPLQVDSDIRGQISDLIEESPLKSYFYLERQCQMFIEKENNKLKNIHANQTHSYQ